MQSLDVVIVGAGITGVAVARLLQQAGVDDCLVLEAEPEAGGLCRTRAIDGHVLDIGGGHLLCSKYQEVYDFIFQHLPESEFNRFERVSKIALGDEVIDYPIEYNLWQLPVDQQVPYLISCVRAGELDGSRAPANFKEWVRWKLGNQIADGYMIPYNQKIWGVDPEELDVDWLEKIPKYDLARVVRACLERRADAALMPSHQTFYYPKVGGFQTVFDSLHAPVRDKVLLNTPLTRLRRDGDDWIVNDAYRAPLVITTIPWRVLHSTTDGALPLEHELRCLQTSALAVTLHEEPYAHDRHWTYVPDPGTPHHREFYIRNFAPHSAPNGIFRETNGRRFRPVRGAIYAHHNEHAYPIPVRGHAAASETVRSAYAEVGVLGVGRWGQHRYYNSDVCIREAMKLVTGYAAHGRPGAVAAMAAPSGRTLT
ncbi:MAG: NAD(P)/FAD-dependent oxidoreductase [Vicinamibacterales bacterium]